VNNYTFVIIGFFKATYKFNQIPIHLNDGDADRCALPDRLLDAAELSLPTKQSVVRTRLDIERGTPPRSYCLAKLWQYRRARL